MLLTSLVLKILFKIWCDSCGQFFHAGCLDVPVNKIGKKTLRTENRIILTPGSSEKRSPKRVALIINIKHGKHISLTLAVSRSSVFSYMPFSREMRRLNIYNKHYTFFHHTTSYISKISFFLMPLPVSPMSFPMAPLVNIAEKYFSSQSVRKFT